MTRATLPAAAVATALLAAVALAPALAASPESEEYRGEPAPAAGAPAPEGKAGNAGKAGKAGTPETVRPPDKPAADSAAAARAPHPVPQPPAHAHPALARGRAAAGPARSLALLPTAAAPGSHPGDAELETVAEALRLGAGQAGGFRVLTPEETDEPFGRSAPRCFSEACALRAARRLKADLLLVSEYDPPSIDRAGPAGHAHRAGGADRGGPEPDRAARPDRLHPAGIVLALLDARTGAVVRSVRARACAGPPAPIPFAQRAAWHLLLPAAPPSQAGSAAGPASGACDAVAEVWADSGSWRRIAWLQPAEASDHRLRWAAAGAGMLAAGLGLAWIQGQLLQDDPNSLAPAAPLIPGDGAGSWLRGFFAAPNPGARVAALGGAGLALPGASPSVVLNPAALADATSESVAAARRSLPGGTPSFHLSYAGPLKGGWYQGLAVQHEGDDLANETSLHAGLAGDWGSVAEAMAGLQGGAALKVYLAKVGSGGTGMDRSTGHSAGLGLDLGLKLRLSAHVTAAATVRDALGFLRHANTFTDRAYWELLPPEYRLGAVYQVDPDFLLALDGQKGMVADQVDHVRLGAEQRVFRFLALRAGLHQAFGPRAVRKLSAGFGIDSEGLSDRPLPARVALAYAYDFGLDEDEPLGTGQAFTLEASW